MNQTQNNSTVSLDAKSKSLEELLGRADKRHLVIGFFRRFYFQGLMSAKEFRKLVIGVRMSDRILDEKYSELKKYQEVSA